MTNFLAVDSGTLNAINYRRRIILTAKKLTGMGGSMKTTLFEIMDILSTKYSTDDGSIVEVVSFLIDSGKIKFCD